MFASTLLVLLTVWFCLLSFNLSTAGVSGVIDVFVFNLLVRTPVRHVLPNPCFSQELTGTLSAVWESLGGARTMLLGVR